MAHKIDIWPDFENVYSSFVTVGEVFDLQILLREPDGIQDIKFDKYN